jgi:hypothetical protein
MLHRIRKQNITYVSIIQVAWRHLSKYYDVENVAKKRDVAVRTIQNVDVSARRQRKTICLYVYISDVRQIVGYRIPVCIQRFPWRLHITITYNLPHLMTSKMSRKRGTLLCEQYKTSTLARDVYLYHYSECYKIGTNECI